MGTGWRLRTLVFASAVVALIGPAFASAALAQDEGATPNGNDEIVLTGSLVVPEGESVATAVMAKPGDLPQPRSANRRS